MAEEASGRGGALVIRCGGASIFNDHFGAIKASNIRAKPLDFRESDGENILARGLISPPPPPTKLVPYAYGVGCIIGMCVQVLGELGVCTDLLPGGGGGGYSRCKAYADVPL